MKLKIMMMATVCGLAWMACNNNNNNSNNEPKATQQGGQTGPEWSLKLQTRCLDGSQDTCVGYYGFEVDATGKYTVGSDLTGHAARVRALSADEAQAIADLAKPYIEALKSGAQAAEKCLARAEDDPSLDAEQTVTLERLGAKTVIARYAVRDACSGVLDAGHAKALTDKLAELATEHYPAPYPDACLDQIDAFEAKYADLQSCSAATDCAYIGEGYTVIPYDAAQVVFEQDYSKVTPIVVGNASKITAQKQALIDTHTALEASCGNSFWKSPVPIEFKQFSSSAGNPLCEQGACKVNPSVYSNGRRR